MNRIKIHVLNCGMVHTSPYLPYNKENVPLYKVAGIGVPADKWVWMPVFTYYIEHPNGRILVDTAWHRRMSPDGKLDKKAQIKELGFLLYRLNQGFVGKGLAVDEQLNKLGVKTSDLDYVVLTHLDCDHACGVEQVGDAKRIIVSRDEMKFAHELNPVNMTRYKKRWWKNVPVELFEWEGQEGPFKKSYDLFGDSSVQLINIPGHTTGLAAVKITNNNGKYVLIDADGAYGKKSWQEMILPGISENRHDQLKSLEWIRRMSLDPRCIESLATHDSTVRPHIIDF